MRSHCQNGSVEKENTMVYKEVTIIHTRVLEQNFHDVCLVNNELTWKEHIIPFPCLSVLAQFAKLNESLTVYWLVEISYILPTRYR